MAIENQNWTMYQGEDFTVTATLYRDKKKTPETLDDAAIIWQMFSDSDRALKLTKSTEDDDLYILDAAKGTINFEIGSAETHDLLVGDYYHELWVTKVGKDILEFKGKVKLKEGHSPNINLISGPARVAPWDRKVKK